MPLPPVGATPWHGTLSDDDADSDPDVALAPVGYPRAPAGGPCPAGPKVVAATHTTTPRTAARRLTGQRHSGPVEHPPSLGAVALAGPLPSTPPPPPPGPPAPSKASSFTSSLSGSFGSGRQLGAIAPPPPVAPLPAGDAPNGGPAARRGSADRTTPSRRRDSLSRPVPPDAGERRGSLRRLGSGARWPAEADTAREAVVRPASGPRTLSAKVVTVQRRASADRAAAPSQATDDNLGHFLNDSHHSRLSVASVSSGSDLEDHSDAVLDLLQH
eukprot:EG_transcript_14332